MPVGHATGIVVAGCEEIRSLGSIILFIDIRLKENVDKILDSSLVVGRISVPDNARRG